MEWNTNKDTLVDPFSLEASFLHLLRVLFTLYMDYSSYLFTIFFKLSKCKKQFLISIFLSKEFHSPFIDIPCTNYREGI